jgi:hypothetical protein
MLRIIFYIFLVVIPINLFHLLAYFGSPTDEARKRADD